MFSLGRCTSELLKLGNKAKYQSVKQTAGKQCTSPVQALIYVKLLGKGAFLKIEVHCAAEFKVNCLIFFKVTFSFRLQWAVFRISEVRESVYFRRKH